LSKKQNEEDIVDEEDHSSDEDEADITDEVNEESDEEINIDDVSDEDEVSVPSRMTKRIVRSHFECGLNDSSTTGPVNKTNERGSPSDSSEASEVSSDQEDEWKANATLENNIKLIGSAHSAFKKPEDIQSNNINQNQLRDIPRVFSPSTVDTGFNLSNYFYHMSGMLNNGAVPLPTIPSHPMFPGFNAFLPPTLQSELYHRQMLHYQMLMYNQEYLMKRQGQFGMNFTVPNMPSSSVLSNNKRIKTEKVTNESVGKSSDINHTRQSVTGETLNQEANQRDVHNNNLCLEMKDADNMNNSDHSRSSQSRAMSTGTASMLGSSRFSMFGHVLSGRRPRDPNRPAPVKKYKCDLCSRAFSRSNTLVTHRVGTFYLNILILQFKTCC
jgi:hypothetical protein